MGFGRRDWSHKRMGKRSRRAMRRLRCAAEERKELAAAHLSSVEVRSQRKDQQRDSNEDRGESNNAGEADEPGCRRLA